VKYNLLIFAGLFNGNTIADVALILINAQRRKLVMIAAGKAADRIAPMHQLFDNCAADKSTATGDQGFDRFAQLLCIFV
jgi:hypothetical protein